MEALSQNFKEHLDQLKAALQNSELLDTFLDEESPEIFKEIIDAFEPHIAELYTLVAEKYPLQLISLEKELLDVGFEGLFLPRILGYAVLRGEINENYKYKRPQNHFKDILTAICNSTNFEFIKMRIGQTLQVGFALSSDIWITNFMDSLSNRKVKTFLSQQKTNAARDLNQRIALFNKYIKQFENHTYQTAEFPQSTTDMKIMGTSLVKFLEFRADKKFDNTNLIPSIEKLIDNKDLDKEEIFLEIIMIIGMFYDICDDSKKNISQFIDKMRTSKEDYIHNFFKHLQNIYGSGIEITPDADKRMVKIINTKIKDGISSYYTLMNVVHTKGYVHEDTINNVRDFYNQHEGLSLENESLRDGIFGYCESFLNNLDPSEYVEYFEINKVFVSYINIFFNQKFNQNIKSISLKYINKLINHFSDKRSRDYQDIKKFVMSTFSELGFMNEKELKSLFATKK